MSLFPCLSGELFLITPGTLSLLEFSISFLVACAGLLLILCVDLLCLPSSHKIQPHSPIRSCSKTRALRLHLLKERKMLTTEKKTTVKILSATTAENTEKGWARHMMGPVCVVSCSFWEVMSVMISSSCPVCVCCLSRHTANCVGLCLPRLRSLSHILAFHKLVFKCVALECTHYERVIERMLRNGPSECQVIVFK